MLTISQLAAYAGVTVRAVRHYHAKGLLPEPQRDHSGYRRYDAAAVVELIRIRTLAEAGVPLSRIHELLAADEAAFATAISFILVRRMQATETTESLGVYGNIAMLVLMAPLLPPVFEMPTAFDLSLSLAGGGLAAAGFVLLVQAFRNMDAGLEDASRICGGTQLGTLFQVTLPLMRPVLGMLVLLALIRGMQSFEVERVIMSHPAVEVAAVFPVPSDLAEDEVMTTIVVKEGAILDGAELIRFCEGRLSYFAIPRFVDFVPDLPRTESGKVQKFKLREQGRSARTWDREAAGIKLKR